MHFQLGVYTDGGNYCRKLNLVQQSDMKETELQNVEQLTTGVQDKEGLLVDVKMTLCQSRLETLDHRQMRDVRSTLGRVVPYPPRT